MTPIKLKVSFALLFFFLLDCPAILGRAATEAPSSKGGQTATGTGLQRPDPQRVSPSTKPQPVSQRGISRPAPQAERYSLGHQSEQSRGPSWSERMKQLMFGLFYPAVLGALLYDILLAGKGVNWLGRLVASDRKLLTAGLLVLHFVLDFVFTQEVGGYRASVFGLDVAIVVLLFIAYNSIYLNDAGTPMDVGRVAISLSGTYLCFLLWEYLLRTELGFHLDLFIYELAAFILFLSFFLFSKFSDLNSKWLVWLLTLVTIAMGVIGSRILEKYHATSAAIGSLG